MGDLVSAREVSALRARAIPAARALHTAALQLDADVPGSITEFYAALDAAVELVPVFAVDAVEVTGPAEPSAPVVESAAVEPEVTEEAPAPAPAAVTE